MPMRADAQHINRPPRRRCSLRLMSAFTVAIRGKADISLCAAHVCF